MMNKNEVLILCQTDPNNDPVFKKWVEHGYNANVIFHHVCKPARVVRRIVGKSRLPFGKFIYGSWIDTLNQYTTVIIHASNLTKHLPWYIHKHYPSMRIIMWYWNHVNERTVPDTQRIPQIEYWSFDRGDCTKYDMHYNIQYYEPRYSATGTETAFDADVFYIGHDHGRKAEILRIKDEAERQGLKCDFRISRTSGGWVIPYAEVEKIILSKRAILEINQIGQVGVTLRAMEALFYNKKLITNNIAILQEPYYCKDNIFIIGYDDSERLSSFVKSPYNPVVAGLKEKYNLDAWFNNFEELKGTAFTE